jgi:hypothetical protein
MRAQHGQHGLGAARADQTGKAQDLAAPQPEARHRAIALELQGLHLQHHIAFGSGRGLGREAVLDAPPTIISTRRDWSTSLTAQVPM